MIFLLFSVIFNNFLCSYNRAPNEINQTTNPSHPTTGDILCLNTHETDYSFRESPHNFLPVSLITYIIKLEPVQFQIGESYYSKFMIHAYAIMFCFTPARDDSYLLLLRNLCNKYLLSSF